MLKLTCDWCGREYHPDSTIPKVVFIKKVNLDDITSKIFYAERDYCDVCSIYIERMLTKQSRLSYQSVDNPNHYSNKIINGKNLDIWKEQ
jgi:hypothetical protein